MEAHPELSPFTMSPPREKKKKQIRRICRHICTPTYAHIYGLWIPPPHTRENLNHQIIDQTVNTYIHIYTYTCHILFFHVCTHVYVPPPHIRGNQDKEKKKNYVSPPHIRGNLNNDIPFLYLLLYSSSTHMHVLLLHTHACTPPQHKRGNLNHEILDNTVKITVFEALWGTPLQNFHLIFVFFILYNMYTYIYMNTHIF